MTISLAHLGPTGTYSESAAIFYGKWLKINQKQDFLLCPQPSNSAALTSVINEKIDFAVVPVENSIEGTVNITLDTLWQQKNLKVIRGFTMPIIHCLLSCSEKLEDIKIVYSHPQGLGQCQQWLKANLPQAQLISSNSTTAALKLLPQEPNSAAISSARAAELYKLPVLFSGINDRPDNCTRFLVVGSQTNQTGTHISLAFSLEKNSSGALVKALQVFADRQINLSKIESRPTKKSLGEYLFFLELEGSLQDSQVQEAIAILKQYAEEVNIFGNYSFIAN